MRIKLCSLQNKNKKIFNQITSEIFITNLVNSQKPISDNPTNSINDFLKRIYGVGQNIYLEIVKKKTGTTVGFLWYRLHDEQLYLDMAYICLICVLAPHRKKGYAAIALKLLEKYIKEEKGIARIALTVSASNAAAIELYKSDGFKPIEIIMQKTL